MFLLMYVTNATVREIEMESYIKCISISTSIACAKSEIMPSIDANEIKTGDDSENGELGVF